MEVWLISMASWTTDVRSVEEFQGFVVQIENKLIMRLNRNFQRRDLIGR